VWEHIYDTLNHQTLRAFDRTGTPRGPGWTGLGGDPSAQLTVAPSGESLLAEEFIASDGLGSHLYGVVGQRFDRDGAPLDGPAELTPPLPDGSPAALASDLAGNYYAAWWARGRHRASDVLRVLVWRFAGGT
jgi:hypothetical protein